MPGLDFSTATAEQLAAVTPHEFISIVKGMSDKDVHTVMTSDNRSLIIGSIFERMPELFRPESAGSVAATTHWSITDHPDGGADEWTVHVIGGQISVVQGHEGDSSLSLAMAPLPFTKVITKSGNPVMMFMTGKIKARGDLGLAANFPNFFDIPKG